MSVATLGLAIDSSAAIGAAKALNGLTAAAKPAAQAADQLAVSGAKSETVLRAIQSAADRSHVSFDTMEKRVDASAKATAVLGDASTKAVGVLGQSAAAANGVAKAHAGMSTQAMAAQHSLRSMIEMMAMGMPPTQILASQMNHLSYAATGPGGLSGAFKEVGTMLSGLLTPMRVVVGGLAAVSLGALAAVHSVAKLALQFEDSARAAGTSVAQLQGFAAAASFKGISNSDFLTSMDKFASSVYDAKNNMGGLADVLRANHQRAGDLVHDFGSISDLIKSAAGNTQLQFSILSQSGLPATMQWVRFLSQGKDAIVAQAAEFMKNGDQMDALAAKAKAFQEAWDKAITNLKLGFQSAVLSIVGFFDNLGDKVTSLLMKLPKVGASIPTNLLRNAMNDNNAGYTTGSKLTGSSPVDQFYSRLGKNAPGNATASASTPVDPQAAARALQLEQQRLGLLGSTTTAEEAALAVQLQADQASANGVSVDQKRIDILKQLAREQSLGITQIKSQIDSYNVETATVGMSVGAATAFAAAQNAINDAKRAGRSLTQDNIAAIKSQAAALGEAAAKADLMNAAYSGLVRGPLQTLTSQIANGAKFFDALKSGGISALNAIASKLADMAAQSLWTNALGGAVGGSGGGLLGKLFGGGGVGSVSGLHSGGIVGSESTFQRSVDTSMFATAPRFHTGLMPDEFPAILQKGEGVFTKGQMAAMGGANDNGSVNVPVTVNIDATGADAAGLARVAQSVADLKANLPGLAVKAVQGARKRRVAGI